MPGSSRTRAETSDPRRISRRRVSFGRPDEDVRRAALAGEPLDGLDQIVARLLEEVRPEHARQPAQRRELRRLLAAEHLVGLPHPERVEL